MPVGLECLLPPLSSGGAPYPRHSSVSTSRSSNRTGGFPASGSRTRSHAFAHRRLRVRSGRSISPRWSWETLAPSARFKADTINVGPGQRYDVIWTELKPGKWLIHCHISHHTTNNNVEMKGGGGLMMIIDVAG